MSGRQMGASQGLLLWSRPLLPRPRRPFVSLRSAWVIRWRAQFLREKFARDSALEGDGFELPVPVRQAKLTRFCR